MTEHQITIRLTRPGPIERWAHRRRGAHIPTACSPTPWVDIAALLVPHRWRRFHHRHATRRRLFWLPCPSCGQEFGGHEAGESLWGSDGHSGRVMCPPCSRNRARR